MVSTRSRVLCYKLKLTIILSIEKQVEYSIIETCRLSFDFKREFVAFGFWILNPPWIPAII